MRAKIELTIRDLQYDHFITKVPTGRFLSNFAYFWHGVLAFNLLLIFKTFVLTGDWKKARTTTLRLAYKNISPPQDSSESQDGFSCGMFQVRLT